MVAVDWALKVQSKLTKTLNLKYIFYTKAIFYSNNSNSNSNYNRKWLHLNTILEFYKNNKIGKNTKKYFTYMFTYMLM